MRRHFYFYALITLTLTGFSSTAVSQFGSPVPRYPQEMDGPVNVITRAAVFSVTDIAVPGRGLGIEFTRHYNSQGISHSVNGPSYMGYRWSHSYQWRLMHIPNSQLTYTVSVITGSGSKQTFTTSGARRNQSGWENRIRFTPKSGVRATLKLEQSGGKWAYIYTTRRGIRYKFETFYNGPYYAQYLLYYVLTEISDPNGNRVKLHYEPPPAVPPRPIAVEDTQGRILKFYYNLRIDDVDYTRHITKVEFGLGTKTALTTVYQTVNYTYSRYRKGELFNYTYYNCLTSAAQTLGSSDPRGASLTTQYEYNRSSSYNWTGFGYMSAVVSPLGYRTEFSIYSGKVSWVRVRDVPPNDNADGDVLYVRYYVYGAFNVVPGGDINSINRKHYNAYGVKSGYVINQRHEKGIWPKRRE